MDVLTILGAVGIVIGIIAGLVQVIDYWQKRRQQRKQEQANQATKSAPHLSSQIDETVPAYLVHLRQLFTTRFNESELRTLCFDLSIDYESLSGDSKGDKARELIAYMQRNGRLAELVAAGKERRPHAPWDEKPAAIHAASSPTGIPHNLPRRRNFVGRESEKAAVLEALRSNDYLISIEGIGGIGKSSLAVEVAHICLEASRSSSHNDDIATFDGFIWTSAKDQELTLNDLTDTIARTLNYPGIAQLPLDEKLREVRKLLQAKAYLLIVDNFETIQDTTIRTFLHDLPAPSQSLITTREQRLRKARVVALQEFTQADAFELMHEEGKRLGLKALETAAEATLLPLYQATGGAPLAIKWATGQIKQKGQSLDTVIASLQSAKGAVFDNIFSRCWSLLSDKARTVLITMPLFTAPADRADIGAASNIHNSQLDAAIGQLVEMTLVNATDELEIIHRRYDIHPLTRFYTSARLGEKEAFAREARERLLNYYITASDKVGKWGTPAGFAWFENELPNILGLIKWANEQEKWEAVIDLFQTLIYFLGSAGYWQERLEYGKLALHAATQADNRKAMAHLYYESLAWVTFRRGKTSEARRHYQSSIQLFRDLGETKYIASGLAYLSRIYAAEGRWDEARNLLAEAEQIAADSDYIYIAPTVFTTKGRIALAQGDLDSAQAYFTQALEATREKGAESSISSRLIDLAYVALAQNRLEDAAALFQESLVGGQEHLRQDNMAKAELGLARVYARQGKRAEAGQLAASAREKFERMAMQNEIKQAGQLLQGLTMDEQA